MTRRFAVIGAAGFAVCLAVLSMPSRAAASPPFDSAQSERVKGSAVAASSGGDMEPTVASDRATLDGSVIVLHDFAPCERVDSEPRWSEAPLLELPNHPADIDRPPLMRLSEPAAGRRLQPERRWPRQF